MAWKNVRIRDDLHDQVAAAAAREDRSVANWVGRALAAALSEHEGGPLAGSRPTTAPVAPEGAARSAAPPRASGPPAVSETWRR